MPKYKIRNLNINNFKLFDSYSFNVCNSDLILLGGPNGFGKTSIFDSLELALTGSIDRLLNVEGQSGYSSVVVKGGGDKGVNIKLELEDEVHNALIIHRELKNSTFRRNDCKINNFKNLWNLKVTINGKDEVFTQEKLNSLIGQYDLERYYNLFYYVQQSDTAHFLKKGEKERLDEISRLFDIHKENIELEKLKLIKQKMRVLQRELEDKIRMLKPYSERLGFIDSRETVKYFKLFTWLKKDMEIDTEQPHFPTEHDEVVDLFFDEIDRVQLLLNHKESFKLDLILRNIKPKLKDLILYDYISKNEEDVLKDVIYKQNLIEIRDILLAKDYLKITDEFLNHIKELCVEAISVEFENQLKLINDYRKQLVLSEEILNEILNARSTIINSNETYSQDGECLLCGHAHADYQNYSFSVENKTKKLKKLQSNSSQNYNKLIESFNDFIINQITPLVDQELKNKKYIFEMKDLNVLEHSITFEKVLDFLSATDLEYKQYMITNIDNITGVDSFEESAKELDQYLANSYLLSDEYKTIRYENNLMDIFKKYFLTLKNLDAVTNQEVRMKKSYLVYKYLEQSKSNFKKLNDYINTKSIINQKIENIDKIIEIYKKSIGDHLKKVISDIEITFFIYSGKIINTSNFIGQNGVFLKDFTPDSDNLKTIRFITNRTSEHDAINMVSAGQLAGIVLALTLTMKKIYGKGLDCIFIDDPVQTLDDLNMVSFVDLLRNEFKDSQIFISTHESDVEDYIRYKFEKHDFKSTYINLKECKLIK